MAKRVYIDWDKTNAPRKCINRLEKCIQEKIYDIDIVAPKDTKTYPNICVPLAGIFEWYKSRGINFNYIFIGDNNYVRHTSMNMPLVVEELLDSSEIKFSLDKVWKYSTSEGVNALVSGIINAIRETDVLESGNLTSTEWCINEVMDNVLIHSEAGCGYVMGQLHKATKRISICIFDMGIGIYNTLKRTKYAPRTPLDAITLALQERITRDENIGQGNGMWGLHEIIKENNGSVRVMSNGALYSYANGGVNTKEGMNLSVGKNSNGTLIDFQIDYSKKIDVAKALNGHKLCDFWLEDRELDGGEICFEVKRDSSGTGTRIAAEKFKNIILNAIEENNQKIILNFEGVNVVSSSYADELIGKIVAERGFVYFLNHFQLINLSHVNIGVINRSVEQRMGHVYYETVLNEESK